MNPQSFFTSKLPYIAVAAGTLLAALPTSVQAQQVNPCRQLGQRDTVVIIEASNQQRMQLVNQVVSQKNLQGDFCASQRTGRTVWMSQQLQDVDTAVRVFDYFRAVGLVSPVNPSRDMNPSRPMNPNRPALPGNSIRL